MYDKVGLISCTWNTHAPQMLHSLLSEKDDLNSITLSDGTTKLLDLLLAMNNSGRLSQFLSDLANINVTLDLDSPFWPGSSILHLAVLMTEETKLWEAFLEKSDSQQKLDSLLHVHNLTEENKNKYHKRIEICLEKGCSVYAKNADGLTPIHLAFKLHDAETSDLLLSRCTENLDETNDLSFLHIACALGNMEVVKQLLNLGADVNTKNKISFEWFSNCQNQLEHSESSLKSDFIIVPENSTPLHTAVIYENKETIEILLDEEADIYAQNAFGLTPIHVSGIKSIAQFLLKKTPHLQERLSIHNLSHLHVAALADDTDVIEKVLQTGAKIDSIFKSNGQDLSFLDIYHKRTPLHVALECQNNNAVRALLRNGADIFELTRDRTLPMQMVMESWGENVVRSCVERFKQRNRVNEEINEIGLTLLHVACYTFDYDWAMELLNRGADVDAQIDYDYVFEWNGYTPLHMLMDRIFYHESNEGLGFVKMLVKYGADVLAIAEPDDELTVLLMAIEHLTEKSEDCTIPVSDESIVQTGVLSILDVLLESQRSYEFNPHTSKGFSHFHYACMRNKVDVVKRYLANGIDVNHKANLYFYCPNNSSYRRRQDAMFTPLHFALYCANVDVARVLIEQEADVKAQNRWGENALHMALIGGIVDFSFFELLFSKGLDINERVKRGAAIDYLFKFGKEITHEQLKFFLDHGSSIDITRDQYGGTLALAMKNAKVCDRQSIFDAIVMSLYDEKGVLKNDCNLIENIVEQYDYLERDYYLYAFEKLISMGCDIDHRNNSGKTALDVAVCHNNIEAVHVLLRLGANINTVDRNNQSPICKVTICGSLSNYMAMMIADHVWKMKIVGLKVHEVCDTAFLSILAKLRGNVNPEQVKSHEVELANLAEKNMGGSLTIRSFLYEWGAVVKYPTMSRIQKENVDKFFAKSTDMREQFPKFCGLLMMQYRKALDRMKLHKIAMSLLPSVLQVDLPSLCLENVLKYFGNDDLYYFIKWQCPGRKILVQSPTNCKKGHRTYARVSL